MKFLSKGFYVKHVTSSIFCFWTSKEIQRAWHLWHTGGWFITSYLAKPHLKFLYCFCVTGWDLNSSWPLSATEYKCPKLWKKFLFCLVQFVFLPLTFNELAPKHSDAILGGAHFPSSFSFSSTCILKSWVPLRLRIQHPGFMSIAICIYKKS